MAQSNKFFIIVNPSSKDLPNFNSHIGNIPGQNKVLLSQRDVSLNTAQINEIKKTDDIVIIGHGGDGNFFSQDTHNRQEEFLPKIKNILNYVENSSGNCRLQVCSSGGTTIYEEIKSYLKESWVLSAPYKISLIYKNNFFIDFPATVGNIGIIASSIPKLKEIFTVQNSQNIKNDIKNSRNAPSLNFNDATTRNIFSAFYRDFLASKNKFDTYEKTAKSMQDIFPQTGRELLFIKAVLADLYQITRLEVV